MSNFVFISWIFVNKNFSCLQDFGCTTTPAAKAIHRVPTSLGLQSKQTHWISPKLVPAPEECSPVLFPYPWLHFRAELHTSQSSKETLPKVSDSFNISIQRSVYVWECAAQPYGLYGKTCNCTMIQKAGCKKNSYGSNFVQPKLSCKPTFIVAVKAPSRTRHMGHVLFSRRISLLAPYLTSY